jgi:hypothetical protein
MSGLRIRASDGQTVRFDTSTRNFLFVGTRITGQSSGSYTDPLYSLFSGERDFFVTAESSIASRSPDISIIGNTIYWTFPPGSVNLNASHRITYGVW